jgi:hypothetical protein
VLRQNILARVLTLYIIDFLPEKLGFE